MPFIIEFIESIVAVVVEGKLVVPLGGNAKLCWAIGPSFLILTSTDSLSPPFEVLALNF